MRFTRPLADPPVSQAVRRVQDELYDHQHRPATTDDVGRLKRHVVAHPDLLDHFRFWLVGSILDGSPATHDIDVLVTPRRAPHPIGAVEEVLLWLARYGRHGLGVHVDALYRPIPASEVLRSLAPEERYRVVRIEDPRTTLVLATSPHRDDITRTGSALVVCDRLLRETRFYSKLPRRPNGSGYLRVAVPFADFGC